MSTEKLPAHSMDTSPSPSRHGGPTPTEEISHNHKNTELLHGGAPPFRFASLWEKPKINPLNLKSYTFPLFNLNNPYGRNFHLAWLGFFVAFLSWFAFPPLLPEAITKDLKLTKIQIANSNIVALCATLIMRLILGPMVDRFGPRLVMAGILITGAIPSGLAGTISNYAGLCVIRFFIGILGGTFVPCVAWTTCFFDTNIVGTANAFAGGWGNMGGGATYAIMVSLYQSLHKRMSQHKAWRVAFAVVPVPVLIGVAIMTLIFGTDHPAGKWSQRHNTPATAAAIMNGHTVILDSSEQQVYMDKKQTQTESQVQEVQEGDEAMPMPPKEGTTVVHADVDVAVNEPLTLKRLIQILTNPLTWLPALAYMTTFGFELAVDSNLASVILTPHPSLGQLNAGYLASVFGLLNLFTRPAGGIFADMLYRKYGVKSKKYFTLALGIGQGVVCIGFGKLLESEKSPNLGSMMGLIVVLACFNELANGANFSLVPHCNAYSNGAMTGLVGAFGNLGGIFFALIFRFQPAQGHGWVIAGAFALGVNVLLLFFPNPKQ